MATSSEDNQLLGILGGGQLAMYLCQAAQALGIETCILCPESNALAAAFANSLVDGDLSDSDAVARFIDRIDVATFDREDIPDETLLQLLEAQQSGSIQVLPSASLLSIIKDKGIQKQWLDDHGFPVVPWQLMSPHKDGTPSLTLTLPFVQKTRTGGFDGRGVQIIRTSKELEALWDCDSLIESFIAERIEIAVITARSTNGEVVSYPPFQMEFDAQLNAVNTVSTPAAINKAVSEQAIALAERLVTELGAVGVCAIEMFIADNETLLINEVSLRVHNSGHLTIEASPASQFEQHVRAVMGLPLMDVTGTRAAAMANILYEDAIKPHCPEQPCSYTLNSGKTVMHWYGKPPGNLGRKMGHITALDRTQSAATMSVQDTLELLKNNQLTVAL